MNNGTDLTVANEIARQLGGVATFAMLGAKDKLGGSDFLQFTIQGCKTINKIKVTLSPDDTYHVEFLRYNRRTLECAIVSEFEGAHAEDLHGLIESQTGLYTRF